MPNRLQALIQQKADLITEGEALRDKPTLTAEEDARYTEIIDGLGVLAPQLAREAKFVEEQRGLAAMSFPDANTVAAAAAAGEPMPSATTETPKPFKTFGHQLMAVRAAALPGNAPDPRLLEIQAASGTSEQVPSDGGFLVQMDFANALYDAQRNTGVLQQRTDETMIGANSNGLKLNVVDETSRVNGSRWGAIQAYWLAEAGTLTSSKPKFRQMQLTLQKLIGLYYATDELLQDADALSSVATAAFADEFGFKVDDALINGTGAGTPLGVLVSSYLVSITKETGQAATSLLAENIEKMYARMKASSMADAEWFINQDTWPQIFQFAHVVGTAGVPMFVPAGGLSQAPFGTLLGRPITPIEQCATLGTVGDIIFANFKRGYKTITKGGVQAASSIHVQFLTDETTFRFTMRIDGQPKFTTPLTPFKGSATQSDFIVTATRS